MQWDTKFPLTLKAMDILTISGTKEGVGGNNEACGGNRNRDHQGSATTQSNQAMEWVIALLLALFCC